MLMMKMLLMIVMMDIIIPIVIIVMLVGREKGKLNDNGVDAIWLKLWTLMHHSLMLYDMNGRDHRRSDNFPMT